MDEDEDDDGAEQYVYTGASSGFERHELVPELPSQRIMDDLSVVKKSRKRARKGKNVDSFPFRQISGSRFVHFLAMVMPKFERLLRV